MDIDSLSVPVPPSEIPVTILCPPNGSTVGLNFTASGVVDGAEATSVVECTISGKDSDGPPSNIGLNWSASFTDAPVGPDQPLVATGSPSGSDTVYISVVPEAIGTCPLVRINRQPGTRKLINSITFEGQRPNGPDGTPAPLSLSIGDTHASFTVGGTITPPNRVAECTIGNQAADSITNEGSRWSATFSKVPPRKGSLKVIGTHNRSSTQMEMVIKRI
jgi:hypothetical protein